jgi:hypothetical protein
MSIANDHRNMNKRSIQGARIPLFVNQVTCSWKTLYRSQALAIQMVALFLCACVPKPWPLAGALTCDQILERTAKESFSSIPVRTDDLVNQVAALYEISADSIRVYDGSQAPNNGITSLYWTTNSGQYRLDVLDESHKVEIFWYSYSNYRPTIKELIHCIGMPDGYISWYGFGTGEAGEILSVMLLYPRQGIVVSSDTSMNLAPDSETDLHELPLEVGALRIDGLFATAPTIAAEDLLNTYLRIGRGMAQDEEFAAYYEWFQKQLTPWPIEGDSIQYATAPYP